MASSTTILKTITLQAGEQFVLPPGAELVGATSIGELESTCDDDLTGEDLSCYALAFGNAEDDGNNGQIFESTDTSNTPVVGIKFDGTEYLFGAPFYANGSGLYNLTGLVTAINGTPAGALIFDVSTSFNWQGDNGVMSYIVFKTLPSIAKKLQLFMSTSSPGVQELQFFIPVRDYADVSGYTNIPSCT